MDNKEIVDSARALSKVQNSRMYEIFRWIKYLLITELQLSVSTIYPKDGAGVYIYGNPPIRILARLECDTMIVHVENLDNLSEVRDVILITLASIYSKGKYTNIVALLVKHDNNEELIKILEERRLTPYDDDYYMGIISNHDYQLQIIR